MYIREVESLLRSGLGRGVHHRLFAPGPHALDNHRLTSSKAQTTRRDRLAARAVVARADHGAEPPLGRSRHTQPPPRPTPSCPPPRPLRALRARPPGAHRPVKYERTRICSCSRPGTWWSAGWASTKGSARSTTRSTVSSCGGSARRSPDLDSWTARGNMALSGLLRGRLGRLQRRTRSAVRGAGRGRFAGREVLLHQQPCRRLSINGSTARRRTTARALAAAWPRRARRAGMRNRELTMSRASKLTLPLALLLTAGAVGALLVGVFSREPAVAWRAARAAQRLAAERYAESGTVAVEAWQGRRRRHRGAQSTARGEVVGGRWVGAFEREALVLRGRRVELRHGHGGGRSAAESSTVWS